LDEVACRNEVGEMAKKRAVQLAMIWHYGRILDRLIYPFDPSMGPGTIRLGKPMLDPLFRADAIERMAEKYCGRAGRFFATSADWIPPCVSTSHP